jgi:hypothetical protein
LYKKESLSEFFSAEMEFCIIGPSSDFQKSSSDAVFSADACTASGSDSGTTVIVGHGTVGG